jgi:4-carboxymuconolactone decarboxylase
MDRAALSDAKYRDLFGERDTSTREDDPEFMTILRRLIFGDVFHTGDLADQTRELITVVVLSANQMLPQLHAHTGAALNVGVTPVELREAVYQCAPFIGFPATLNAIGVINDVFRTSGIDLPLPSQATTNEDDRHDEGNTIQFPLYGDEIKHNLADLPDRLGDTMARLLTEFCFGDFYTRTGLDLGRRELLALCVLASLGATDAQLRAHALGNLKAGNSKATQIAALIHCSPYIGFPRALNAIFATRDGDDAVTVTATREVGSPPSQREGTPSP